jgi:hypothetical protein
MIHTTNFYLYAWLKPEPYTVNMGKKVSRKTSYVSSASSAEFWNDFNKTDLEHYCIFESDDEAVVSAAEWWGLDYGMNVLGKDKFYNKVNNAHRGDQSLVTEEIKQKIVAFYEGKLKPETNAEELSLGRNIIDKVENGFYPVEQFPVYKLVEMQRNQARAIQHNVVIESDIVRAYADNPKQVLRDITPATLVKRPDGSLEIVNGHTRIGAASKCKGWNEIPVCIVDESDFGSDDTEIATNILLAGSYANRRSPISAQSNTDDDLMFQMENYLVLQDMDASIETAQPYIREVLTKQFSASAGSKRIASGIITKIFNKYEKQKNEMSISKNMTVYSSSQLRDYCYKNYEKKGIAVVHSTMSSMAHFDPLGFIFHHVSHMNTLPKKLAIVLHSRTKDEYVKGQAAGKVAAMQRVIDGYKLPITIDVLPAFEE